MAISLGFGQPWRYIRFGASGLPQPYAGGKQSGLLIAGWISKSL
jgi:hypothetical protein